MVFVRLMMPVIRFNEKEINIIWAMQINRLRFKQNQLNFSKDNTPLCYNGRETHLK